MKELTTSVRMKPTTIGDIDAEKFETKLLMLIIVPAKFGEISI